MRRYLQIVRVPDLGRMYAASLLARLPIGINGLAIVLLLRAETGSFGVAGATAGALALGSGLGAPIGGRLIDAFGARLLLPLAGVNAAGLVGLVVLARADAARKRRPHGGRLDGRDVPARGRRRHGALPVRRGSDVRGDVLTQAILPDLGREFGVSPSQTGLTVSVALLTAATSWRVALGLLTCYRSPPRSSCGGGCRLSRSRSAAAPRSLPATPSPCCAIARCSPRRSPAARSSSRSWARSRTSTSGSKPRPSHSRPASPGSSSSEEWEWPGVAGLALAAYAVGALAVTAAHVRSRA